MTFLDSSAIIDMLAGVDDVVTYVEARGKPYFTSTLCVYEVLEGKLGAGETDVAAARQDFGGVRSIDLTEELTQEAARLQDALLDDGERLAARDVMIAATARSTGDELVVTDADFETDALEQHMTVTNLRR